MDVVVCLCACPDVAVAARIADALVQAELAACVNVLPGMRSVYRWQGAVERADEVLLLIKTVRAQVEPVGALVASLHPYELPELLAVEAAAGLPAYLAWVADNAIPPPSRSGD